MKTNRDDGKRRGLSAKSVILPAVLVIILMHGLLVWNTIRINRASQLLSESMQRNLRCAELCSAFSRSTDLLNEYALSFVGSGRTTALDNYYFQRQTVQDTAETLKDGLKEMGLGAEADKVDLALAALGERVQQELQAMRLGAQALETDLSGYPELAEIELDEQTQTLPPWELRSKANALLVTGRYQSLRGSIQRSLGPLQAAVSTATSRDIAARNDVIREYRLLQWWLMSVVITVLFVMAALLFVMMLNPLEQSVALVRQGKPVSTETGFSELRDLAGVYNELLAARDALEANLLLASVTDALTGLPNRTAFQEFINKLQTEQGHEAVTVFSLDVNGLKLINDQKGHVYGDMLLCDAAACVMSALGRGEGRKCFRFGGDEFAAIWVGVPEKEIAPALARFHREQRRRGVSVSEGWARTEDFNSTTIRELFEQADRQMYEQKACLKQIPGGRS